jgi:hypothetical protein
METTDNAEQKDEVNVITKKEVDRFSGKVFQNTF